MNLFLKPRVKVDYHGLDLDRKCHGIEWIEKIQDQDNLWVAQTGSTHNLEL